MKVFQRATLSALGLLAAALLAFSACSARAESVASLPAQPADYVSDFAHVLSPQAVAQLDQLCAELDHTKANAQLAIVTVKSLDGMDAADYAYDLEMKWKIGRKGSDRGALVLLAVNDHKYRIDVGFGLEGILNDAKVGDIGRAMVPYLRAGDYDSAVSLAAGALARVIAADAHVDLTTAPMTPNPVRARSSGKSLLLLLLVIFFGGFFLLRLLLALGIFGGWGGGPWLGGGGPFIGGGGWGSGSGWGGGGGGSGGTGFGGFGGGDFGGGGAGGSW